MFLVVFYGIRKTRKTPLFWSKTKKTCFMAKMPEADWEMNSNYTTGKSTITEIQIQDKFCMIGDNGGATIKIWYGKLWLKEFDSLYIMTWGSITCGSIMQSRANHVTGMSGHDCTRHGWIQVNLLQTWGNELPLNSYECIATMGTELTGTARITLTSSISDYADITITKSWGMPKHEITGTAKCARRQRLVPQTPPVHQCYDGIVLQIALSHQGGVPGMPYHHAPPPARPPRRPLSVPT